MSPLTRRYHIPSAIRRSPVRIDPDEARRLVAEGAVFVDVRRHDDPQAPVPDARRIPPDEIPGQLTQFPKDVPIVLGCT